MNPFNVLTCHPSKEGGKAGQFHVLSHTFSSVFSFFLFYFFIPPFFFSLLLDHNAQAARRPNNQPVNFKKHLSKKCIQVLKMPASSSSLRARGNMCCLPDCPRKRAGPQIPLKLFQKTVMRRRHRSTDTCEPCFFPSPFFILFLSVCLFLSECPGVRYSVYTKINQLMSLPRSLAAT